MSHMYTVSLYLSCVLCIYTLYVLSGVDHLSADAALKEQKAFIWVFFCMFVKKNVCESFVYVSRFIYGYLYIYKNTRVFDYVGNAYVYKQVQYESC